MLVSSTSLSLMYMSSSTHPSTPDHASRADVTAMKRLKFLTENIKGINENNVPAIAAAISYISLLYSFSSDKFLK